MRWNIASGLVVLMATATVAGAASLTDRCEANKLKRAGKYSFCRLKAVAQAVPTGAAVDESSCDAKFAAKWAATEASASGACPTTGDLATVKSRVTNTVDALAAELSGVRFIDNGDGTITDTTTGLMWEQKDDTGGVHDKDNLYSWSGTDTAADGTAFTVFLSALNDCQSADGTTLTGGFAGHCDWRLPTIVELKTIVLEPFPCSTSPCIDPVFGPSVSYGHWTSTTLSGVPSNAWGVLFLNGGAFFDLKTVEGGSVRAVRSAW